jgi:hypothetical protein
VFIKKSANGVKGIEWIKRFTSQVIEERKKLGPGVSASAVLDKSSEDPMPLQARFGPKTSRTRSHLVGLGGCEIENCC